MRAVRTTASVLASTARAAWQPALAGASVLFVASGALQAVGHQDDAYTATVLAATLIPLGTALGLLARRSTPRTQESAP
jgi:hypothetical protein